MNETITKKYNQNTPDTFKVSVGDALLFSIIVFIVGQAIGSIFYIPAFFVPFLNNFAIPLGYAIGFGVSAYILMRLKGLHLQDLHSFYKEFPHWQVVLLVLLFYFSGMPIAEYFTSLIPTDHPEWLKEMYEFFTETFEIVFNYKIAAFITICLLAPLLEELIFRGLILRGMLNKGIAPIWAILLSSVLFGAVHFNPWQFVGATFLGALFGFVYYRTKSLWMVMLLHFINNFIAFIYTLNTGSMDTDEKVLDFNYAELGISVILVFIFGYLIYKRTYGTYIRHAQ